MLRNEVGKLLFYCRGATRVVAGDNRGLRAHEYNSEMSAVSASLLAAGWLLALPQAPTEEVPGSAAATLVEFEIKDQFGEVYTDEPYREGVFVLVGSDRKGSEFSRAWSEAIRESLDGLPDEAEVQLAGLAHVNGVPRLSRGLVRSAFPKLPDAWVLLDW